MRNRIRHILKEMSIPAQVRRRMHLFDETFIHYRNAFMKYDFRNYRTFWKNVLESSLITLYQAWFTKDVSVDDWEESEKFIQDYLTEKYYYETQKMWFNERKN
jgi:hypothetical protein